MTTQPWPDRLHKPEVAQVQHLLTVFWQRLLVVGDLVQRNQHLLAHEQIGMLRQTVLEMMLALNGIQCPAGTLHLNGYLGESQRAALEKTLFVSSVSAESWIGQAVALVVIYRWYAPQLVEKFGLAVPGDVEAVTLAELQRQLPDWPLEITTE